MLVFLLSFVLGSEDSHVPTFWLLLYLDSGILEGGRSNEKRQVPWGT